jgi:hypothetical protein
VAQRPHAGGRQRRERLLLPASTTSRAEVAETCSTTHSIHREAATHIAGPTHAHAPPSCPAPPPGWPRHAARGASRRGRSRWSARSPCPSRPPPPPWPATRPAAAEAPRTPPPPPRTAPPRPGLGTWPSAPAQHTPQGGEALSGKQSGGACHACQGRTILGVRVKGRRVVRSMLMMSTSAVSQRKARALSVVGQAATRSTCLRARMLPVRNCAAAASSTTTVTRRSCSITPGRCAWAHRQHNQ